MRRSEPLPEFPERKREWPGKKDTKRWCKGHIGREHHPRWTKREYEMNSGGKRKIIWMWNEKVCQVCHKILDYDFKKEQSV